MGSGGVARPSMEAFRASDPGSNPGRSTAGVAKPGPRRPVQGRVSVGSRGFKSHPPHYI